MIRMQEEDNVDRLTLITDDQVSSVSKYSNDGGHQSSDSMSSKYPLTPRPTSVPPRHSSTSNVQNDNRDTKQRRRYASDSLSTTNKTTSASLVSSFLQYLRHELKTAASEKKNDYHRQRRQKSSEKIKSLSKAMTLSSSNENLFDPADKNEILTLIDLLVLRVECLTNEKKKKPTNTVYPTVAEVDQNLIEYLYYLFTKFFHDDHNSSDTSMMDKNNFVHVCQTLVRNGCFDLSSTTVSSSSDQSSSDATSSSDRTLTEQPSIREYDAQTDEKSVPNQATLSRTTNDQDTWLVVDFTASQSGEDITAADTMCLFPSSTFDDQLQLTTDNYKSCESESSHSIYFSPNSSFDNIQTMVQEFDETHPTTNISLTKEIGSSTNVNNDLKTIQPIDDVFNDNISPLSITNTDICTRLTNDDTRSEQLTITSPDRMSRREKKMHERWLTSSKTDTQHSDSSTKKILLGVEFPPIAVLRRKFSSKPLTNEKINVFTTTIPMDKTNPDQIIEMPSNDDSSLSNIHVDKSNDDGRQPPTVIAAQSDEDITMREKQGPLLANIECQLETISNIHRDWNDNQQTNNENSSILMITNPPLVSYSTISTSPSALLTITTHENEPIESLPNEEKEKDEEQRCDDDYTVDDDEKKNNSSLVHGDYHAAGTILINDEPAQAALVQQERKEEKGGKERERPSSSLLKLEQSNEQRTEDESPVQMLSNDLKSTTMAHIDDNEARFKQVEIEEILDDEEGEEAQLTQNADSIEPTDYIRTDDEPRKQTKSYSQVNLPTHSDIPIKFDPVLSCYEKALAKVVDTLDESSTGLSNEQDLSPKVAETDPIALRALQRFEERMSAAAAKSTKGELNPFAAKGKSSWSGSLSTPRKSLENLFKANEQSSRPTADESISVLSPSQSDTYIRPRKTFDDISFNYGQTINLFDGNSSIEPIATGEQHRPPPASVDQDDKRVADAIAIVDLTQQLPLPPDPPMTSAKASDNEVESASQGIVSLNDSSTMDTIVPPSLSPSLMPYCLQLEGRRRLNTLERMRERQQSRDSLDTIDQQQQISDDIQDPITRRALERFDEKSRTLNQSKPTNYDEIHDPVTRRALMRLESNLKRTNITLPSDTNENWYTNSYTLGSLQPTGDRVSRPSDLSRSPSSSNNKTTYVSVHQRYCPPSSLDSSEISTNGSNEQQQPINVRQRSRSEDMLSSRDLAIGQTTDLDQPDNNNSAQLQRNRSSNQIALNPTTLQFPNTFIKSLEPNFVRTTESSVSYATPTQTYSAYSCEYTRPRRNPMLPSAESTPALKHEVTALPKYIPSDNDIQRPTPYRPPIENPYQTSSAFAPVRAATTTTATANSYYTQQPAYTSTNPPTDDPIVRRALDRFNCQVQNSLMTNSQHQPNFHDTWPNSHRPPLMTTSVAGYQSIIGRRRQTRYDDINQFPKDNSSIGDGYSSSVFANTQNPYQTTNHYMNMSDEPPVVPPRFRRDPYRTDDVNDTYRRHSIDDYLSENTNNNNNSQPYPQETYIHHAYPATITNATSFRPINIHYNQQYEPYHQEDFRERPQSTSSTNSSDSITQASVRPKHLRLASNDPQSSGIPRRTNIHLNGPKSSDQTTPNNGNAPSDSVFHRLAYTGTKASLSKSSSNSCSNLLNKTIPVTQLKSCEIDFDDSCGATTLDNVNGLSSVTSKYQRSKSVDSRTRLKMAQARANQQQQPEITNIEQDDSYPLTQDEQQRTIPSARFTSINNRRDIPVRFPVTPTNSSRDTLTKRLSSGNNLPSSKNQLRTRGSSGNLFDSDLQTQELENDENVSYPDNYRTSTTIPVQRYIQTSASTSSVSSNLSRTRPPVTIPINLDRRDSNSSTTDINRITNRVVSPPDQRRNIPVSVFSPAKLDNKRPAPVPPAFNYESQHQPLYSSRSSTIDNDYTARIYDDDMQRKSASKTPTGLLMNEYPLSTVKHDNNKKMNVFERLFRGNKKKT